MVGNKYYILMNARFLTRRPIPLRRFILLTHTVLEEYGREHDMPMRHVVARPSNPIATFTELSCFAPMMIALYIHPQERRP